MNIRGKNQQVNIYLRIKRWRIRGANTSHKLLRESEAAGRDRGGPLVNFKFNITVYIKLTL